MSISYSSPPTNLANAPNGYLEGFRVKSYSDRRQRLVLQPGRAVFVDPATEFRSIGVLSTPLEKQFTPFGAGNGNGGIASGIMSANETWYVFLIYSLATGQIDMCFSEDPNCGDCPAGWIFRYLFVLELDDSARPFKVYELILPSEIGLTMPIVIRNINSFTTRAIWSTWTNFPGSVSWGIRNDPFKIVQNLTATGQLTLSRRGIYRISLDIRWFGESAPRVSTWQTRIVTANPSASSQNVPLGPPSYFQLLGSNEYINQVSSHIEVTHKWTANNSWSTDNTSELILFQYLQAAANQSTGRLRIVANNAYIRVRPLAFFDVIEV